MELYDLLDTAIKIGLGSVITIVGTLTVTKLNHKNDRLKDINKRAMDLIETISIDVEEATHVFLRYTALMTEWTKNKSKGFPEGLTGDRAKELAKVKIDLFDQFKSLSASEGKLMLLSLPDVSEKLRVYGELVQDIRRKYHDYNESVTVQDMENARAKLLEARKNFFTSLSSAYFKFHKN
ncbi:hypothetical protein JEP98_00340 [Providencia rettgeri]|uniref:hypothetical protein n=1 Tax=Providencia rettgeri TaxID=587 RepID=UPI0018E409F3|nr:hypothetical protein [Providencia rettgeri]MBI6187610.1 hypothetical protein [Providencia rettgeri]